MTLNITHKHGTTAGTPPAAGDIDVGELAVNAADAEIYTKDTAGVVQPFKRKFLQSGTGAVSRLIESKLQDVVSVEDFGADSTGTSDCSAAILAASQTGKTVYFPSGKYKVTQPINLGGYFYWDGDGATSVIDVSSIQPSSNYVFLSNRRCSVRNLTIDGGANPVGYNTAVNSFNIGNGWSEFTLENNWDNDYSLRSVLATSLNGNLSGTVSGSSVSVNRTWVSDSSGKASFITITPDSAFDATFQVSSQMIQVPSATGSEFYCIHTDQSQPLFRQAGYVQSIGFELYKADGTFVTTWSPSSIQQPAGQFPIALAWNSDFTGDGITQFKVRLTFFRTNPTREREAAIPTQFYVQSFTLLKLINTAESSMADNLSGGNKNPAVKSVFQCNNNGAEVNRDSLFDNCLFTNVRDRAGILFNFVDDVDTSVEMIQSPAVTNCIGVNTGSLFYATGIYNATITNNISDSTYIYEGSDTDRNGDPYDGLPFYNYGMRVKNIGGGKWDKYVFNNNVLVGGHWAFEVTPNTYKNRNSPDRINMGGEFKNNTISGVNCAASLTMQQKTFVSGNTLRTLQGFGSYGIELANDLIDVTVSDNVIDLGWSLNGNCITGGQASKTKGHYRVSGNTLIGTSCISKFSLNQADPTQNGGGKDLEVVITDNFMRCSLFGVRGFGGNATITGNTILRFETPTQVEQVNLGTKTILLDDRDTNPDGTTPVCTAYIADNKLTAMAGGVIRIGRSSSLASYQSFVVKGNEFACPVDVTALLYRSVSGTAGGTFISNKFTGVALTAPFVKYSIGPAFTSSNFSTNSQNILLGTESDPDNAEFGSWTPAIEATTNSYTTMVVDVVRANYTKTGRLVAVNCFIRTNNVDTTGGSGALKVTGLPFTSLSGTNRFLGSALTMQYNNTAYTDTYSAVMVGGSTTCSFAKTNGASSQAYPYLEGDDLQQGENALRNWMIFSLSYYTD